MNFSRNLKNYISVLFSGIYLFAFLFAANIHEHNAGYFLKDFSFKNSSTKFSKQSKINNSDDCLSCHFAAASVVLPDTSEIKFAEFNLLEVKFYLGNYQVIRSYHYQNYLRGPPIFI